VDAIPGGGGSARLPDRESPRSDRPPAGLAPGLDRILGAPIFNPARALALVFVAAVVGGLVWVLPQFREGAAPTAPMQVADRTHPRGSIHAVPAGVPKDAPAVSGKAEEARPGERRPA